MRNPGGLENSQRPGGLESGSKKGLSLGHGVWVGGFDHIGADARVGRVPPGHHRSPRRGAHGLHVVVFQLDPLGGEEVERWGVDVAQGGGGVGARRVRGRARVLVVPDVVVAVVVADDKQYVRACRRQKTRIYGYPGVSGVCVKTDM